MIRGDSKAPTPQSSLPSGMETSRRFPRPSLHPFPQLSLSLGPNDRLGLMGPSYL